MLTKLKLPLTIGLSFYGIAFAVARFLGYNPTSFTIIGYLYVILALVLALIYEYGGESNPLSLLKNVVIVVENEETRLKRVFTGESYKINGKVEKVQ